MQTEKPRFERDSKLYENEFLVVAYEETTSILASYWTPATSQMNLIQYKEDLQELANLYKENSTLTKSLVMMKDFNFPVDPEAQAWGNQLFDGVALDRTAIVVPTDFIAGLGVKQAVDDLNEEEKVKYFDDEKDAREWLLTEETAI